MPRKRATPKPDPHSARPHGVEPPATDGSRPTAGPPRPPRPAVGLPLLPTGRYQLPTENPCEGCDHCCRYVALPIAAPRTKRDFDEIRWYVLHENVSVYVDREGDWMIQFQTTCHWLKGGRCTHYALRPSVCRDFDPADCERYAPEPAEKLLIRNEQDLERFLAERDERLGARRRRGRAGRA